MSLACDRNNFRFEDVTRLIPNHKINDSRDDEMVLWSFLTGSEDTPLTMHQRRLLEMSKTLCHQDSRANLLLVASSESFLQIAFMTPNLPTRFAIACKTLFKAYFTGSFLHWLRLYWFSETLFVASALEWHADRRPASAMPFFRSGAAKEARNKGHRDEMHEISPNGWKQTFVPTRLENLMDHVSNWNHREVI